MDVPGDVLHRAVPGRRPLCRMVDVKNITDNHSIALSPRGRISYVGLVVERGILLHIYVWENLAEMREFTGILPENKNHESDYVACYQTVNGKSDGKDYPVEEGDAGFIHLVEDMFAAGVFAHELQHFLQSWIDRNKLKPFGKDWEDVAYLVGNLTTDFWNWFYDTFEEEKPGKRVGNGSQKS